jgi:hypothetical protein
VTPCVKSGPARLLLIGAGFGGFVAGAIPILYVGDRARIGDPSLLLVGGGFLSMIAAGLGQLASLTGESAPATTVTPPLLAVRIEPSGRAQRGDVEPPHVVIESHPELRLGPALLGLTVEGRVQAGEALRRDLRPQVEAGDMPAADLRAHEAGVSLAPEIGVALPYPLLPAGPALGGVEVRYRPSLHLRSRSTTSGDHGETVQHTVLLPLTFGVVWHLSPRQDFSLYFGPRWDGQRLDAAIGVSGTSFHANNFYGEARYGFDFPALPIGATRIGARVSFGYSQWKVDGRSLTVAGGGFSLLGYMGAFDARWDLRIEPPGAGPAVQVGGRVILADGGGAVIELAVAPRGGR